MMTSCFLVAAIVGLTIQPPSNTDKALGGRRGLQDDEPQSGKKQSRWIEPFEASAPKLQNCIDSINRYLAREKALGEKIEENPTMASLNRLRSVLIQEHAAMEYLENRLLELRFLRD
jgi:hypothetical protein